MVVRIVVRMLVRMLSLVADRPVVEPIRTTELCDIGRLWASL